MLLLLLLLLLLLAMTVMIVCTSPTAHFVSRAGNIYTLPDVCKSGNFGVAHRGPADPDGVLLPASIACSANFESPHIASRSQDRPAGMPLQLTVSITGTQLGVDYKAYIYNNSSKVPVKRFNELAADADDVLPFTGDASGSLTFARNSDSSRSVVQFGSLHS